MMCGLQHAVKRTLRVICCAIVTTGRKGAENHTLRRSGTRSETPEQTQGGTFGRLRIASGQGQTRAWIGRILQPVFVRASDAPGNRPVSRLRARRRTGRAHDLLECAPIRRRTAIRHRPRGVPMGA